MPIVPLFVNNMGQIYQNYKFYFKRYLASISKQKMTGIKLGVQIWFC